MAIIQTIIYIDILTRLQVQYFSGSDKIYYNVLIWMFEEKYSTMIYSLDMFMFLPFWFKNCTFFL